MSTLDNILAWMEARHCDNQALAAELGLNRQVVTDWKAGRSHSYQKYLYQIASFFGVTVEELTNGQTRDVREGSRVIRIAVYDTFCAEHLAEMEKAEASAETKADVCANAQRDAENDADERLEAEGETTREGMVASAIPFASVLQVEDYEELERDGIKGGEYLAFRVHGDSMEPRMSEGDVVILRRQDSVTDGDYAVVLIGNEPAVCRRVRMMEQGMMLLPLNPAYEPNVYTKEQLAELPVRILGKIVELRAKFS